MATTPISSIVRALLTADPNLTNDQLVTQAKARGAKGTDRSIRERIYEVRGELKKKAAKEPAAAPAAARVTAAPVTAAAPAADLTAMLANVALVNAVMEACGGADAARKVADAVRACGGPDAFLLYLDSVAALRGGAGA